MSAPVFALIDGNSFYCSCERVFEPRIARRPLIVASNNDSCVISRTDEAKSLGVKMGEPLFKIKDFLRRNGVVVRSSNYALYGDMSRRMNEIYATFSPKVEIYSIDESFLDLDHVEPEERPAFARRLKETTLQWTGIPTCVGIGPTKTLAKVGNKFAKKQAELGGVCDLSDVDVRNRVLDAFAVEDIWGIGSASAAKIRAIGIDTAGKLRDADPGRIRRMMSVVGERTVHELRGVSCMPLELLPPQRKGMAVTRGFSSPITEWPVMREAVTAYATRVGEKLREHGLAAVHGQVFMHTSLHQASGIRNVATQLRLDHPTDDTLKLCERAAAAALSIWRDGYRYAKAGIILTELMRRDDVAPDLLWDADTAKRDKVNAAMDAINSRFGRGSVIPASTGLKREWSTKAEMRSPRYTTRLDELPVVQADD